MRSSDYFSDFNKEKAFTLAEVLITLGIIGVVSAMTIPNLMSSYNKHVVETKLKKTHSTILQAFKLMQAENGDFSFESLDYDDQDINGFSWQKSKDIFDKYLSKSFKVANVYPKGTAFNVYTPNGKYLGQSRYAVFYSLLDGTVLGFTKAGNYDGANFDIILNPQKKKLIAGKDVFYMDFRNDDVGSYYYKPLFKSNYTNNNRKNFINYCSSDVNYPAYYSTPWAFCTFLIIQNNFKIPADYPIKL